MSPELISALLWIPFALVVLISGLIFCRSGYRKGLWRALLALGATLVAAVISFFLAKLLGSLVAPLIMGIIPNDMFSGAGTLAGVMTELVNGLIKMGISLVLFPLLLFIFTIVLRIVSARIQKDKLTPTGKGMRWGGLGVGAASALLYTTLLLLPLYGTCSAYVPAVETIITLQESDKSFAQSEAAQYLQAVSKHPVVQMFGAGSVSAVYGGLATLEVGDAKVDVSHMAVTADKVMSSFNALATATEENFEDLCKDLVDVLRQDVVETNWFYSLATEALEEARSYASQADEEMRFFINTVLDILDCSREDFEKNCEALLDFAAYALENDIAKIIEDRDFNAVYSAGIDRELGKLANASDQMVAVKKLALAAVVSSVLDNDINAALVFLEDYDIGILTDAAAQKKEAEALLLLIGIGENTEYDDVIKAHPALGEDALAALSAHPKFEEPGLSDGFGPGGEFSSGMAGVGDITVPNQSGQTIIIQGGIGKIEIQ